VAMGLGFSTSQYFATVFRRYTGMTPGEFRRSTSARAASEPPRPRASRGSGPSPARPRP
jgi:AraC-like DNA-binding protein